MIELVVAVSVFAILAGGLALTIDGGLNLARNNRNRSIAANLASQEMDQVRQEPFTSLPLGLVDRTESVDGVPYTVRRETEWVDNASTTGPCDSTNGDPAGAAGLGQRLLDRHARRRAGEVVDDPEPTGRLLRPGQRPHRGEGARQHRRSARRRAGHRHRARVQPQPHDHLGRLRVLRVRPAGRHLHGARSTRSATSTARATPTRRRSPASTSGATSSIAFDYDQAATLTLTLSSSGGGSFPSNLAVGVGQHRAAPDRVEAVRRAPGAIRTVGNLFPYADGYSAWVGSCADADPEGKDGNGLAFWPGASRGDRAADVARWHRDRRPSTCPTSSCATATSRRRRAPYDIVAVHDADNGCPTGLQYTIGTFTGPGDLARRAAVRHLDVHRSRARRRTAGAGRRSPSTRGSPAAIVANVDTL